MSRFSEKQSTLLNAGDLKSFKGKAIYWSIFTLMIIVVMIVFIPVLWMVFSSFKTTQEMYLSPGFLPREISFGIIASRIYEAWTKLEMGKSMWNTLILSLGDVLLGVIVCSLAGYVLSKKKVIGTKLVFTLVVWTLMMPGSLRTVSTYMSYISFPFVIDDKMNSITNINILDTYLPMWLGRSADCFAIILFKNNFDAIPNSLVESAEIDGCSMLKTFWRILLPISTPVIFYVAVGKLSVGWEDYFTPYLVIKDLKKQTTPALLFLYKSSPDIKINDYMMGLMFACVPTFLIYCIFQRRIMGGMTTGAVKG